MVVVQRAFVYPAVASVCKVALVDGPDDDDVCVFNDAENGGKFFRCSKGDLDSWKSI